VIPNMVSESCPSLNVEQKVVRLEGVVKSDASVEQRVYFVRSRGVKPRLKGEAVRGLYRPQGRLYSNLFGRAKGVLCSRTPEKESSLD